VGVAVLVGVVVGVLVGVFVGVLVGAVVGVVVGVGVLVAADRRSATAVATRVPASEKLAVVVKLVPPGTLLSWISPLVEPPAAIGVKTQPTEGDEMKGLPRRPQWRERPIQRRLDRAPPPVSDAPDVRPSPSHDVEQERDAINACTPQRVLGLCWQGEAIHRVFVTRRDRREGAAVDRPGPRFPLRPQPRLVLSSVLSHDLPPVDHARPSGCRARRVVGDARSRWIHSVTVRTSTGTRQERTPMHLHHSAWRTVPAPPNFQSKHYLMSYTFHMG
jgi:hypothetical protein